MGVFERLAVTCLALLALQYAAERTAHVPVDADIRAWNVWMNSFVVPQSVVRQLGLSHELTMYLRNFIAGSIQYHVLCGLWALYIYVIKREHFFPKATSKVPTVGMVLDQIFHAQCSLFSYALLPVLSSFLSERKFNRTYSALPPAALTPAALGQWLLYVVSTLVYLACVEVGIYWMHRKLHTVKFLYNHVHLMHHKYNKPEEMSPYAAIAFHPLDGLLQACPYVILLHFLPVHFLTSLGMLFFSGIWAMNIHDNVNTGSDTIMGAKYHTAHHVYYTCNYGQFFTFCDRIFGTFRRPSPS